MESCLLVVVDMCVGVGSGAGCLPCLRRGATSGGDEVLGLGIDVDEVGATNHMPTACRFPRLRTFLPLYST